ncbi:MAG: hypothetical protein U0798_20995 [Gemmataceae bacterium]
MTANSLFGILIMDREPFTFQDLPGLAQAWLMDAGGFAALGLFVYLIYSLFTPTDKSEAAKERSGVSVLMVAMAVLSLISYAVVFAFILSNKGEDPTKPVQYYEPGYTYRYEPPKLDFYPRAMSMTIAGLFAMIGFGEPFFRACLKLSFRRIYAVAKLCFLEALRNRLFFIFLISLIPYLIPTKWFNNAIKPEDELRSIVTVPYMFMQGLSLATALLLSAFSIPNDIKRQTIYTIVTKPVQRLEIVLGRFCGYMFVMTLGLLFMVLAAIVFIRSSTIDKIAKDETYRSRVPVRGDMVLRSRKADFDGTNVGREFDYRKYIAGDPSSPQRAIWSYSRVPSSLTNNPNGVRCEFTFDIFRLTKGEENKGVTCSIVFATHACPQVPPTEVRDGKWKWVDRAKETEFKQEAAKLLTEITGREQNADSVAGILGGAKPNTKEWEVASKLAEKYGFFEVPAVEVYDFHPTSVLVPDGFFKNAAAGNPPKDERGAVAPRMQVFVKCESSSQMLGMAKNDLYILEEDNTFEENYIKSMFGLWCRIAIAVAIAICLSTYLSGVISLLTALMMYLGGYAMEHIEDVARGTSTGGGPFQSFTSLMKAEQPTAQRNGETALEKLNSGLDVAFQWLIRRVENVIPDVEGYAWSHFVREGFDVRPEFLVMNAICLVAYLLPWTMLAYYLLRSREVADT